MKTGRIKLATAILFTIAITASSCNLFGTFDEYREDVCGNYDGYKVYTYWYIDHYEYDTTLNVVAELTMGEGDSIVDFVYHWSEGDSSYTSSTYSFKYDGTTFTTTGYNTSWPPILTVEDETLHFNLRPGQAPNVYDVFATKAN